MPAAGDDQASFHDSIGNDTYIASSNLRRPRRHGFLQPRFRLRLARRPSRATAAATRPRSSTRPATTCSSGGRPRPRSTAPVGRTEANGFAAVDRPGRLAAGGTWRISSTRPATTSYVAGSNYAWLDGAGYRELGRVLRPHGGLRHDGNDDRTASATRSTTTRLELDGRWAKLNGIGFFDWSNGFDRVNVSGSNGGTNTVVHHSPHEFVFSQLGTWAT